MSDVYKGDTNKYSVWISDGPYNKNGNTFIHLCSDATFSYNLSYALNAYNELGNDTTGTIVTDTASGAVGNISINGTRVNPSGSTDNNPDLISNAVFEEKMTQLLSRVQMWDNAYVLRLFRADWRKTGTPYRDLYVFFYNYDQTISWDRMNEMTVNFSFYRRNLGIGFGI